MRSLRHILAALVVAGMLVFAAPTAAFATPPAKPPVPAAPNGQEHVSITAGPVRQAPSVVSDSARAAAVWCRWFQGTVTYDPSYMPGYTWSHKLDVCYDGSRITSVNVDTWDWTRESGLWSSGGIVASDQGDTGSYSLSSYKRGHLLFCTVAICSVHKYPAVGITAHANGTADFFGWRVG